MVEVLKNRKSEDFSQCHSLLPSTIMNRRSTVRAQKKTNFLIRKVRSSAKTTWRITAHLAPKYAVDALQALLRVSSVILSAKGPFSLRSFLILQIHCQTHRGGARQAAERTTTIVLSRSGGFGGVFEERRRKEQGGGECSGYTFFFFSLLSLSFTFSFSVCIHFTDTNKQYRLASKQKPVLKKGGGAHREKKG